MLRRCLTASMKQARRDGINGVNDSDGLPVLRDVKFVAVFCGEDGPKARGQQAVDVLTDIELQELTRASKVISDDDGGVVIDIPKITDRESRSLREALCEEANFISSLVLYVVNLLD